MLTSVTSGSSATVIRFAPPVDLQSILHVDVGEATRFLRQIDARARIFTFQTFAEKGNNSPVPRVIHSNSLAEIRYEHANGAGVYVVVNETDGVGRKTENITRIRAVFQEDDDGYDGTFPLTPRNLATAFSALLASRR